MSELLGDVEALAVIGVIAGGVFLYYKWKSGGLGATIADGVVAGVNAAGNTLHDVSRNLERKIDTALFPNRARIGCAKAILILNTIFAANPITLANGRTLEDYHKDEAECLRIVLIPIMSYLTTGKASDPSNVTEDDNMIYARSDDKVIIQFNKKTGKLSFLDPKAIKNMTFAIMAAILFLYGKAGPIPEGSNIKVEPYSRQKRLSLDQFMHLALKNINARKTDELPVFRLMPPTDQYKYGALVADRPNITTHKMIRFIYPIDSAEFYNFIMTNIPK